MLGNIHTNVAIVVPNYKWVLGLHAGDGLYPLVPNTDLHSDASTRNVVVHGVGSLQPWAHKGHHLSHSQYVSINPYFHIFRFYHLYFLLAECLCRVSRPLMPSSMLHLPLVNVLFLAFHPSRHNLSGCLSLRPTLPVHTHVGLLRNGITQAFCTCFYTCPFVLVIVVSSLELDSTGNPTLVCAHPIDQSRHKHKMYGIFSIVKILAM